MRWKDQSQGAGEWPGLKQSTIRQRKLRRMKKPKKGRKVYKGGGGKAAILRDLSILFTALDLKASDAWKYLKNGVRVGFMSPRKGEQYENGVKKPSSLSISEIAAIHQFGKGHNPKRPIIVEPSKQTVQQMMNALKKAAK